MEIVQWSPKVHYFADVKSGTKVTGTFVYKGIKKIKNISTSCGCTTAVHNNEKLDFTWNVNLAEYMVEGEMSKTISVEYEDNTKDVLTIKAHVKR